MKKETKRILKPAKALIFAICGLGIAANIFLFTYYNDFLVLFLIGLWLLVIWLYNFEGRISLGSGLISLALCPLLLIFQQEMFAKRTAVWAFIFLAVGVSQLLIDYLKEVRKNDKEEKK